MAGTYSLGEIAAFLNAEVRGDCELRISGLNTLQDASSSELAFLANEKYVSQLAGSSAAAVIISPAHLPEETLPTATLHPIAALIWFWITPIWVTPGYPAGLKRHAVCSRYS